MKKVFIFMADGFEEVEALTPCDILRRAEADVTLVSVKDTKTVTGARGVNVVCDDVIDNFSPDSADLIILPGGYPGFENLANCQKVLDTVKFMLDNGRFVAAICGAPAAVLGKNGFLTDKTAVCYPGMEDGLCCKQVSDAHVCVDGNVITAKAAASAMEFAFVLTEILCGKEKAGEVKKGIVYDGKQF